MSYAKWHDHVPVYCQERDEGTRGGGSIHDEFAEVLFQPDFIGTEACRFHNTSFLSFVRYCHVVNARFVICPPHQFSALETLALLAMNRRLRTGWTIIITSGDLWYRAQLQQRVAHRILPGSEHQQVKTLTSHISIDGLTHLRERKTWHSMVQHLLNNRISADICGETISFAMSYLGFAASLCDVVVKTFKGDTPPTLSIELG